MSVQDQCELFVTTPSGMAGLLKAELESMGVQCIRESVAGVQVESNVIGAMQICLWSRLANKVLLPLAECPIDQASDLYTMVRDIEWDQHMASSATFVVDFSGTNEVIKNTQFGAQTVKDAIVDQFREGQGARPSVDRVAPEFRVNVYLAKGRARLSIDLSGESLHKRNYRHSSGAAPLKENLAAAILMRSDWPNLAAAGAPLVDPMCGSGTILIEAAMMACDVAPGLLRRQFGFMHWLFFDSDAWQQLREDAERRKQIGIAECRNKIIGYDIDKRVIELAQNNIFAAGVDSVVHCQSRSVAQLSSAPTAPSAALEALNVKGLLICNPPYGERLGDRGELQDSYFQLAKQAKQHFSGWMLSVFTGDEDLARGMRLRAKRKYKLFNGKIPCVLSLYEIASTDEARLRVDRHDNEFKHEALSEGAQMVVNRLRKNKKKLLPWLKREGVTCYRLYDADLPEYAAAIDVYNDQIHIQEYKAPKSIETKKARNRLNELLAACLNFFECDQSHLHLKSRQRNRGSEQYEKVDAKYHYATEVEECGARLKINLSDYLDTGLFLDHRPLRRRIAAQSRGKRFLNLYCYTATATVHAALGGASASTSVDMSNTYLDWARDNFNLNNLNKTRHELVRADCSEWLRDCRSGYDLIMLDPPTFSNSKKMQGVLDVQRDHSALVHRCMELLNPNGILYFSNNLSSFKLDATLAQAYSVEDITELTLDADFQRNKKIHRCWEIRHA